MASIHRHAAAHCLARVRLLLAILLLCAGAAQAAPLTLAQLIERARARDPRVKEARAQLRWFKAKYDEARWAWFPRLETWALVGGPTPEARNDGMGGPPSTPATRLYDLDFGEPGAMFRAGAEAVLPVYTFGKLDALEQMGAKGVEVGLALEARAEDEAELQVSQAYWGYCLAQAGKDVIADTLERLEDARVTLERLRKQESEQVTQMDVYKLEFYRKQAEVQLAAAEAGSHYALSAIRLLIGEPPDAPLELALEPLPEPQGTLPAVDALAEAARRHRPELKAVEAGVAARGQEVLLRERMYYPDFGVAGFVRWAWTTNTTRQLTPFAYDPYNELSAGVGLVMRYTWDFPQKSVQLEQARAELEKLERQRELLGAAARLEIDKAWADTTAALSRAEKQTAAEKSARRWATAAFTAFDVGTGDTRELVDSFTALALSSAARVQAYHDVQVGLRALSRAVGAPVNLLSKPAPPPPAGATPR